jgi:hypothetical protein
MRKNRLIMFIAIATITALAAAVRAHHLPAPTGLVCPVLDGVIQANWDDLLDPTTGQLVPKYSVNIIATYDTGLSGDTSDDTTVDGLDFGTGDRGDGLPATDSSLGIPLSVLDMDFGLGPISPYDVLVRVKGLHPGKPDSERQNNFFSVSPFCDAL